MIQSHSNADLKTLQTQKYSSIKLKTVYNKGKEAILGGLPVIKIYYLSNYMLKVCKPRSCK